MLPDWSWTPRLKRPSCLILLRSWRYRWAPCAWSALYHCAVEKINLRHLFSSVKGDEVLLQSFSKKKALLQEKTLTGLLIYWPPQWNHCIYLMIFFMPKNQQIVVLFLLGFIPTLSVAGLGIKPRHTLGKRSTTELCLSTLYIIFDENIPTSRKNST